MLPTREYFITLFDDGEGIFRKIQRKKELTDERYAVLELSEGKLTTDPDNHTSDGTFDCFKKRLSYISDKEVEDWIRESQKSQSGTGVFMKPITKLLEPHNKFLL